MSTPANARLRQSIPLQQIHSNLNNNVRPVSELYEAVPLPEGRKVIRVIDIHGLTTPFPMAEDLSATLRVVELDSDSKPSYTTLSYVWGQLTTVDSPSITLHAAGIMSEIRLTENCFQALLHLRAKLGAFTIWVDAICIDQSGSMEKTHQLNQMGDIYAWSSKTFIWLGVGGAEKEQHLQQALEHSNPLSRYFRAGGRADDSDGVYERKWTAVIMLTPITAGRMYRLLAGAPRYWITPRQDEVQTSSMSNANDQQLEDLLGHQWIKRVWTYQELMLAQRPFIVFGQTHIAWPDFAISVYTSHTPGQPFVHETYWSTKSTASQLLPSWDTLARDRERFRAILQTGSHHSGQTAELTIEAYRQFLKSIHKRVWIPMLVYTILLWGPLFALATRTNSRWTLLTPVPVGLCWVFIVLSNIAFTFELSSSPPRMDRPEGILAALWRRKCTEPKDYNFGVRSILQYRLAHPLSYLDYTLPQGEIFRDLTVQMLEAFACDDIIISAIDSERGIDRPSWVADWTRVSLSSESFKSIGVPLGFEDGSTDRILDYKMDATHPNILHLRGKTIGTVESIHRFRDTRKLAPELRETSIISNIETFFAVQDGLAFAGRRPFYQRFVHAHILSPTGIFLGAITPDLFKPKLDWGTTRVKIERALVQLISRRGECTAAIVKDMAHIGLWQRTAHSDLAAFEAFVGTLAERNLDMLRIRPHCLCGKCPAGICAFTSRGRRLRGGDLLMELVGFSQYVLMSREQSERNNEPAELFSLVQLCYPWGFDAFNPCPLLSDNSSELRYIPVC